MTNQQVQARIDAAQRAQREATTPAARRFWGAQVVAARRAQRNPRPQYRSAEDTNAAIHEQIERMQSAIRNEPNEATRRQWAARIVAARQSLTD